LNTPVYHIPVLCREAVDLLVTETGGMYVDGTVGGGGHAEEICTRLHDTGRLLCLDADAEALTSARTRLASFAERTFFVHTNFRYLRDATAEAGWTRIHGVLLDLGVSSHQLDAPERGLRSGTTNVWTCGWTGAGSVPRDIVNTRDEQALAKLFWEYGEERLSRRIARRLVTQRPVETSARCAMWSPRWWRPASHEVAGPASFQALRIAVNGELESSAKC
jgi:16S rRNA (cytosine1402-N4)-methyltransferase